MKRPDETPTRVKDNSCDGAGVSPIEGVSMLLKNRAVSAGPSKSSRARDGRGVSSSSAYNSRIWFRRFNVPFRANFYPLPRESEPTSALSPSSSESRGNESSSSAFTDFTDPRGFTALAGFAGFPGFDDFGFAGFPGFPDLADSRGCAASSGTAVFASRARRRCRAGFPAGIETGETVETEVFRGLPRRLFTAGIGWEGTAGISAGVEGTEETAGMDGTDGTAGIEAMEGSAGTKFPAVPGSP